MWDCHVYKKPYISVINIAIAYLMFVIVQLYLQGVKDWYSLFQFEFLKVGIIFDAHLIT